MPRSADVGCPAVPRGLRPSGGAAAKAPANAAASAALASASASASPSVNPDNPCVGSPSRRACDDSGRTAVPALAPTWGPICAVLALQVCERMAFFGMSGSQKPYLNRQLGHSASSAASLNSVMGMLSFLWCLPGGLLADVFGRYRVIVATAAMLVTGFFLVAVSTLPGDQAQSSGTHFRQTQLAGMYLLGSLVLIPLGAGGIKPSICNFGADQIGDTTAAHRDLRKKLFSYFYMASNLGALLAFGVLVNVTTGGLPSLGVPLQDGYFVVYLFSATSLAVAVAAFLGGTWWSRLLPGGGIESFRSIVASIRHSVGQGACVRARLCVIGWLAMPLFFTATFLAAAWPDAPPRGAGPRAGHHFANAFEAACGAPNGTARVTIGDGTARRLQAADAPLGVGGMFDYVALGLGLVSCFSLVAAHLDNSWVKPLPASRSTTFTLAEVRKGLATLPFLIVINVAFSMPVNAVNEAMPSQGCQMNTMVGGSQMNGVFFRLFNGLSVVVFTPVFEAALLPALGRVQGSPIRAGQKLVAGMLLGALGNAAAAALEMRRRAAPLMCSVAVSECAPAGVHMRDISAFWMILPNALLGVAEILVYPCMYAFAYEAAPPRIRSLVQAMSLFFSGCVSNAFTTVALRVTFPDDLDSGHMENYYFLNTVCVIAGLLLYVLSPSGLGTREECDGEAVAMRVPALDGTQRADAAADEESGECNGQERQRASAAVVACAAGGA
mmetsp:Transcript_61147/g.186659  ORF Transcript_61147/g.186659 Transcript_61147/m.186659 type:complete len:725 (-) Transcript_61147:293-2467(-)